MHPHEIAIHAEPGLYGSSQDQFLQDEDTLSVAELIPQILMERKSFLHISEESIAAEIEQKSSEMDVDENGGIPSESPTETSVFGADNGESIGNDDDDGETAIDKFQKQKVDLLAHIGSALNETSLSLDFVSLLMSAEKPNITRSTISPHLSKIAPLGSLSADRLRSDPENTQQNSEKSKKTAESIGMGWKYQSLRNVTNLFRDAAGQLRGQVAVEKTYWNQINIVLSHDEVLYKLRDPLDNTRAIGVQYGYGDSGSTYYDKGRAVLRKDPENGVITFCPLSSASDNSGTRNKYTRVRILSKIDDDYMLTGQSALQRKDLEKHKDQPILNALESARFFLFEDDLFYHLIREAKNLISYNVTIIADKIIVDVMDQIIELESVYYDENDDDENLYQNTNDESCKNNQKAQHILNFLKLMLCCYYRYRLKLKQKMPTSFTKWKQANSHPLLLRPFVGHTRHQSHCRKMGTLLEKLCVSLPETVSHSVSENRYANLRCGHVDNPFEKAVKRPVSTFTLVLERAASASHLKVEIEVTTTEIFVDLVVKLTVSKYNSKEDLEANQGGSNVLHLEFTDLVEVGESLEWTLANFLEEAGGV